MCLSYVNRRLFKRPEEDPHIMSELLFRGIWTLVATALYITQFTVSNVGFGDSATVVEQNLKLNESERSDFSGGQESTTHASPLSFTSKSKIIYCNQFFGEYEVN